MTRDRAAGYRSWAAIDQAIKDAAAARAAAGGPPSGQQIRTALTDRFLSRVFTNDQQGQWLLKGGTGMLARVPTSRTTTDVDLATNQHGMDEAAEQLHHAVRCDLGDHLTFHLASSRPAGLGNTQPGVLTRRLSFDAIDPARGRTIGRIPVDLVVAPAPTGTVETRHPADRLTLARDLPISPYRLWPIVDQVADKVCATLSTNYPNGAASSRVKDLVDLVIIARTQQLDLDQLRVAIATKQALDHLPAADTFTIPSDWEQRYQVLARATPATGGIHDTRTATALVRDLVDPALQQTADTPPRQWNPEHGWTPRPAGEPEQATSTGPGRPARGRAAARWQPGTAGADQSASGSPRPHHRGEAGTT